VDATKFDDDSLMRLINNRQEAALSKLYDRYSRLIYSIALSALGEPSDAEEIVQDVFLRVWERAETYQAEQGKMVAWLARIARNRSIDLLRRRKVRLDASSVAWEELIIEPADEQDAEWEVELKQQEQRLRSALAQLPPEQKEVLALAYFQGLSHQEIADRLRQPLGTVKTRLRSAMQKLRGLVTE
jgi:RNA polymerase sigma-70 factor (family 1)